MWSQRVRHDGETKNSTAQALYRGWINNKVLLCSKGNYIQYLVKSKMEKNINKRYVCVCVCVYIYIYMYIYIYVYITITFMYKSN